MIEDQLLEIKALGWAVGNIYERTSPRRDTIGDDMEKHWNVRICRQNWCAYGSADTLEEALHLAIEDIPLAMLYHVPKGPRPPHSGISLEDLGL